MPWTSRLLDTVSRNTKTLPGLIETSGRSGTESEATRIPPVSRAFLARHYWLDWLDPNVAKRHSHSKRTDQRLLCTSQDQRLAYCHRSSNVEVEDVIRCGKLGSRDSLKNHLFTSRVICHPLSLRKLRSIHRWRTPPAMCVEYSTREKTVSNYCWLMVVKIGQNWPKKFRFDGHSHLFKPAPLTRIEFVEPDTPCFRAALYLVHEAPESVYISSTGILLAG
jgi:hypothetical protein